MRRLGQVVLLAALSALGLAGAAQAYVIKSYAAQGVYNATDLECNSGANPPPNPALCFNIPFSARLDYIDGSPGIDNDLGLSSVILLQFIGGRSSLSFQYQSFDPQPAPPPNPAILVSALIEEHGDGISVAASVLRQLNDVPSWSFGSNGSLRISSHGEGGVADPGSIVWLKTQEIPEPGGAWLCGIALAGLYRQRAKRAALRQQSLDAVSA